MVLGYDKCEGCGNRGNLKERVVNQVKMRLCNECIQDIVQTALLPYKLTRKDLEKELDDEKKKE